MKFSKTAKPKVSFRLKYMRYLSHSVVYRLNVRNITLGNLIVSQNEEISNIDNALPLRPRFRA